MKKTDLALVMQPQEFFRELVTRALESQKVGATEQTEFYLVNLLNQFMTTENLFQRDGSGQMKQEPLVLMVKDALEEPTKEHQHLMFRQVGDVSLYTAGFFQESLKRKLVDVDYYIDMGGAAYQQAAQRTEEKSRQELFAELAELFSRLISVMAEISEQTTFTQTESDLLKMYDLWFNTGSERAKNALKKAGIDPLAMQTPPAKKKTS